jgi:hypothetical protein
MNVEFVTQASLVQCEFQWAEVVRPEHAVVAYSAAR